MAAYKDINLSAATVTYNGVTFGGSTAAQKSLPPRFRLSMQEIYDSSGRVFVGLKHTLSVQCIFYETSQAAMAANMAALRTALSKAGAKLEIRGLGTNFDTVVDIAGGPKPMGFPEMRGFGDGLAWELLWTVEFTVNPCYDGSGAAKWVQFNYSTNWSNDYEGRTTRSIAGHYEIVHVRNPNTPNAALERAEVTREGVVVAVPDGFRRVQNSWTESENHKRMDFAITDEQMSGDPYPIDVIEADGDETFSTNPLTWAKSNVSLNLTYRVAPDKPRTEAGFHFLAAAASKQNSLTALLGPDASVIPSSLTLRNGKYQSAQVTSGSISWVVTGCAESFLSAGGLWRPVGDNTYDQWKTSIDNLWSNRGNSSVAAAQADDVIIDLCNNASSVSIGNDTATPVNQNPAGNLSFTCPDVGPNGGYLGYDVRVTLQREDNQTLHRRAVPYVPAEPSGDPDSESVATGDPEYSSTESTEHVIENNGIPSMLVILRYRMFRYKENPVIPEIKTVGGQPVTLIQSRFEGPQAAGTLMGCPYKSLRGYRIYRVNAYVASMKGTGSAVNCPATSVPTDY